RGRLRGIFQNAALVTHVPYIAVAAEDFLGCRADRNVSLLRVSNSILTGTDIPLTPGSNNLEIRCKSLVSQFEAHLIVAFSCAAMRQGVRTFCKSNLNLALGKQWPGDSSTQQVLTFVHGAGLHERPQIIGDEFTAQVFNKAFGCTALYSFVF